MDLLASFRSFIKSENLFIPGEPLLLAVSGGLDSVVLCELSHQAGYDCILAHANFQLRGEESGRDEAFVRDLAKKYQWPLLVKKFETEQYALEHKLSIQVAARELRYAWFREIIATSVSQQPGPRRIVTAHHLDDNIETLLMNFFKGTGITGLRGILPLQGDLARPLLFAGKEALREFAVAHQLDWVEDSSNSSDKYTRNYFRHQVIPLVRQVFPEAISNLADNTYRFRDIETLYRQSVNRHLQQLLEYRGAEVHIPVLKLKKTEPLHTIAYEIIKEYGFSSQQVGPLIGLLDSDTGKYICSATHRILRNRNWLIITPLQPALAANILIGSVEDRPFFGDRYLTFQLLPFQPEILHAQLKIQNSKFTMLAADAVQFPLLLRRWQPGDYFYPLGMPKKKKLSRFLIDNKLSLADKEKVWVLEMNKKIVWVVGMRIDHRFRVTPQTRQVLKIESGLA